MLSQQEAFIKCRDLNKPNAYADEGLSPQKLLPQEADKTLVAFKKAHVLKALLMHTDGCVSESTYRPQLWARQKWREKKGARRRQTAASP